MISIDSISSHNQMRCVRRHRHICAVLTCLILPLCATPIDNSVIGDPKVECTGEQVGISFTTQKPFNGRVFVRGYASQKDCVMTGADRPPGLSIGFTQCGVQRSRQLSPPGMIVYTTVIISFHPIFVTKVDRAYRVACHYMEASRTVTADMEVSMLTTAAMSAAPAMPECKYELLIGGPTGQPAKYAKVGEQIYHKWTCDSKDNAYCMRVHTCLVDDGQGNESYTVINRQGCATDKFVLQNLEYLTDLMAGQEAHVVKFADKATLYFSCQIELLSKASETANCVSARPNCTDPGTVVPAVSAAATTTVAAAPAASHGEVRRRVARHHERVERSNHSMMDSMARQNFQVVGDMDLLRQHLTVFDLEDTPGDNTASRGDSRLHAPTLSSIHDQATVPSAPHERYASSKVRDSLDISGPICISPLGFGFAVFGLLSIFLIALASAVKFAMPSNRRKYDENTIISADYNVRNLPRHLSVYEK